MAAAPADQPHESVDWERVERLSSVGLLASGIVHDFNNVLGCARLALGLAYERCGDDDLRSLIETANLALDRGETLSGQLLRFVRGSGSLEAVDVNRAVGDAVALVGRLIGSRMPLVLSLGEPGRVLGSSVELAEILINLALNARDAMPEGGRIEVSTGQRRHADGSTWAVISVRDTGVGMSPDAVQRVFEPFYTTKRNGSGLGLATVRSIVTRHGGSIAVETTPGGGTTFEVALPAVTATGLHAAPAPLTVLVADDDPQFRSFMAELLSRDGNVVLEACSGFEAVARAAAHAASGAGPVDVLVADVCMPSMDGVELARTLCDTPALLVSSFDPPAQLPAGAAFLRKPFSAHVFAGEVAAAARRAPGSSRRRGEPCASRWIDFESGAVPGHAAIVYDGDADLIAQVAAFVTRGIAAGEPAVLAVTAAHREQVEQALAAAGLDVAVLLDEARLTVLDAHQALAAIRGSDGALSAERIEELMGRLTLDRIAAAWPGARIHVFDEIVDLLAEAGALADAVWLEERWNELAAFRHFSLLCGYRSSSLHGDAEHAAVACAHTHVHSA